MGWGILILFGHRSRFRGRSTGSLEDFTRLMCGGPDRVRTRREIEALRGLVRRSGQVPDRGETLLAFVPGPCWIGQTHSSR
jgi:hypothetical protein